MNARKRDFLQNLTFGPLIKNALLLWSSRSLCNIQNHINPVRIPIRYICKIHLYFVVISAWVYQMVSYVHDNTLNCYTHFKNKKQRIK